RSVSSWPSRMPVLSIRRTSGRFLVIPASAMISSTAAVSSSGCASLMSGRQSLDRFVQGERVSLSASTIPEFHLAIGGAAADDEGPRDADELGVSELHARRDLRTIVVEHVEPGRLQGG